MPILVSSYSPLRTEQSTYQARFETLLQECDEVFIATGYVSADALVDLRRTIEVNERPELTLIVGMHMFDGITRTQLDALDDLHAFLQENSLGEVRHVMPWPYHGKVVSFKKDGRLLSGFVGSSNLSNIVASPARKQYEVDIEVTDFDHRELDEFINELCDKATKSHGDVGVRGKLKIESTLPINLSEQDGVSKASDSDLSATHGADPFEYLFEIPLKTTERSNLNSFNGRGRTSTNGFEVPRSWYEVELIVGNAITRQPGYPQKDAHGDGGVFEVITDDGWQFKCKVSGDHSKNLRSEGDLKILGKWIKGRLEEMGSLRIGELITEETLTDYGRSTINLSKFRGRDLWYLDFSVEDID